MVVVVHKCRLTIDGDTIDLDCFDGDGARIVLGDGAKAILV